MFEIVLDSFSEGRIIDIFIKIIKILIILGIIYKLYNWRFYFSFFIVRFFYGGRLLIFY